MWFNGNIDNNNKIHFDRTKWICTDPDERQFCRIINPHEFEYIQLKDGVYKDYAIEEDPINCDGYNALTTLDGITTIKDWHQCEIDVTEYSAEEIAGYLAPYGGILDGVDDEQGRNQLIAECIFETDIITGEID